MENTIGNSEGGPASIFIDGPTYRIDFGTNSGSYMLIHVNMWGISLQAEGCDLFFAGSVGMCGSWDSGGLRFKNGTSFDISGGYDDVASRSHELADSWKIPIGDNLMFDPSEMCDASSLCGPLEEFECEDFRRHLVAVLPACPQTCEDISILQFREQCLKDVELTGDISWACTPNYLNPILAASQVN